MSIAAASADEPRVSTNGLRPPAIPVPSIFNSSSRKHKSTIRKIPYLVPLHRGRTGGR